MKKSSAIFVVGVLFAVLGLRFAVGGLGGTSLGGTESGSGGSSSSGSFSTSYVHAIGYAGLGSSDTVIVRHKEIRTVGSGWITVTTNATEGAKYTVLQSGVYAVSISQTSSGGGSPQVGVTADASGGDLTTSIQSMMLSASSNKVVCYEYNAAANCDASTSATQYFPSGTVLRAHCSTAAPNNVNLALFRIQQITIYP